jgi:hypothetical protein
MYKDKKITFKQVNEQEIEIYLEYKDFAKPPLSGFQDKKKLIGRIQSPSGTDGIYSNAIMVCGISEAFDYWGCGLFGKPKVRKDDGHFRKYYYNDKGEKIMEQVRDIQLYFDDDTQRCALDGLDDCDRCFNTDCTCDNKCKTDLLSEDFGKDNPFELKRADDIKGLSKVKKEVKN